MPRQPALSVQHWQLDAQRVRVTWFSRAENTGRASTTAHRPGWPARDRPPSNCRQGRPGHGASAGVRVLATRSGRAVQPRGPAAWYSRAQAPKRPAHASCKLTPLTGSPWCRAGLNNTANGPCSTLSIDVPNTTTTLAKVQASTDKPKASLKPHSKAQGIPKSEKYGPRRAMSTYVWPNHRPLRKSDVACWMAQRVSASTMSRPSSANDSPLASGWEP